MARTNPHIGAAAALLAAAALTLAAGCARHDGHAPGGGAGPDPQVKPGGLVPAGGAAALERYLKNGLLLIYGAEVGPPPQGGFVPLTLADGADTGAPAAAAADTAFSGTNVQEAGVDEADTVKFDGTHLYLAEQPDLYYGWVVPILGVGGVGEVGALEAADGGSGTEPGVVPAPDPGPDPAPDPAPVPVEEHARIRVLEAGADPPAAHEVGTITLDEAGQRIAGLYLDPGDGAAAPDLLVAVGEGRPEAVPWGLWMDPWTWSNGRTTVSAFDVTEAAAATPKWTFALEGDLVASRKVGSVLYLVTRQSPYLADLIRWPATEAEAEANRQAIADAPLADLLPKASLDGAAPGPLVAPEDCFLPAATGEQDGYPTLIAVTALDVRDPAGARSVCLGGVTHGVYASTLALYLAGSTDGAPAGMTVVHKFALEPGGPRYRGSATVPGDLGWRDPRYRMGEQDGVLRLLTTVRDFKGDGGLAHRLTLLAEAPGDAPALAEVAHLPSEADPTPIGKPDEDVYAVRFAGARGYVVTFRRVDPLYVLDLADASAPKVAGALEVPGFSEYLHPVGSGLLVGVGHDAPADPSAPTLPLGVRVALFDVADPAAPREVAHVVIGERGTDSGVSYDPHAFAYLAGDGGPDRLALPVEVHQGAGDPSDPFTYYPWDHTGLYLFEIDSGAEAALRPVGAVVAERPTEAKPWPDPTQYDRAVIQGPAVHYVHAGKVWSAAWTAPEAPAGPE